MTDLDSAAGDGTPRDAESVTGKKIGTIALAFATVQMLVLHVLLPEMDPFRTTLSDYALTRYGWMFDSAVVALVAGSALLLPWRVSIVASFFHAAWCVGLLVILACQRDAPGGERTLTGDVHALATIVALASLPLGALFLHGDRRLFIGLAIAVSLMLFVTAPIGLAERLVAAAEVTLIIAMQRRRTQPGEPSGVGPGGRPRRRHSRLPA